MNEINDYLSKADKDIAKNVMYRVYGMPGPLFMENEATPTPEPPISSNNPFYVENITNDNTLLSIICNNDTEDKDISITVEYSLDKKSWKTLGTTSSNTPLELDLEPNKKVYLRANSDTWSTNNGSRNNKILSSGSFIVGGNIMSLLYGSSFTGEETTFPSGSSANFAGLFSNGDFSNLVSASELILPATTLTDYCYTAMFNTCTALTSAPVLPATTLADYCYAGMFFGCTALITSPVLPATTLAENCYNSMFNGCTSLNEITIYANDISAENCLDNWVYDVSSGGQFHNLGTAIFDGNSSSGCPSGWIADHPEYIYYHTH